MPAGTHTWGMRETLLGPQALPPPPVRHALFVSVIALAAILHLGTAGWSDIHNGVEGEIAGGARHLAERDGFAVRVDDAAIRPALPWLIAASYKVVGFTPFAARLPIAVATIASIALTFLIGERLSGYWRGFIAALVQLCSLGAFVWGQAATPEPLVTVFFEAAILFAVTGYAERRRRAWSFAAVWLFAALMLFAGGLPPLVCLASILIVLAIFFREARIRFRELLRVPYVAAFALITGALVAWLQVQGWRWQTTFAFADFAGSIPHQEQLGVRAALFNLVLAISPGLLLVLPAVIFAWRRVIRPHEFEFVDAVPLCWLGVGLLALVFSPGRDAYDALIIVPAFALSASCAWERSPRHFRLGGVALAAAGYLAIAAAGSSGALAAWLQRGGPAVPLSSALPLVALIVALAALAAAAYLSWRERENLAIAVALLGALPLCLAAAEAIARHGPYLSFAATAHLMQPRLGEAGEVIVDAAPRAASSLGFYLDRAPWFIDDAAPQTPAPPRGQRTTTADAIERFGAAHPVYLVIHKGRVPTWQEALTARYHLYHQVSTCGDYVIVDNQP